MPVTANLQEHIWQDSEAILRIHSKRKVNRSGSKLVVLRELSFFLETALLESKFLETNRQENSVDSLFSLSARWMTATKLLLKKCHRSFYDRFFIGMEKRARNWMLANELFFHEGFQPSCFLI